MSGTQGASDVRMYTSGGAPQEVVRLAMVKFKKKPRPGRSTQAKATPSTSGVFAAMRRQVRRVPRGKVATYGDIAYAAGYPGAARQVAWSLHAESRTLPWHRIVGAGGAILLGGEAGLEQRMRLRAEGVSFRGLRVNLSTHRHVLAQA
jgi:methylated-DNA-protein-cysteine methyltransferase related protein